MGFTGYLIILLVLFLTGITIYDINIIKKIKHVPALPQGKRLKPDGLVRVYEYLSNPESKPQDVELNEDYILSELSEIIEFINKRFDCSDFWCQLLFRLYKDYSSELTPKVKEVIKKTFLDFKYWMDEPGADSMCYWSENHCILFAELEYLAGQEWEDETFSNSGLKGSEHKRRGYERLMFLFKNRFKIGFYEWYSNNYFNEDIGPVAQLIDYAKDREIVEKAKIFLDLIMFEVASHSAEGRFSLVSSRMYGDNKASNEFGNRIQAGVNALFYDDFNYDPIKACAIVGIDCYMMVCLLEMLKKKKYTLPKVIKEIALDNSEQVIKSSNGLNPKEYKEFNLIGQNNEQIMEQLSNEAFTNYQFILNSFRYIKSCDMFTNEFTQFFKWLDLFILRWTGAAKLVSYILGKRLLPNGITLGRGNVYCYRNNGYLLATAMRHSVDSCGTQEHIWQANLADNINVFTQQPSSMHNFAGSPGYWGGNGRVPMSVQDKAVNLTIYKIPTKKRLGEGSLAPMTHIYFPKENFDKVIIEESSVFGSINGKHIGILSNQKLKFKEYDKESAKALVQHVSTLFDGEFLNKAADEYVLKEEFDLCAYGEGYHMYVTELSDSSKESFEDFIQRLKQNELRFEENQISYKSENRVIRASYEGLFEIDGKAQNTDYKRFESVYSLTERFPKEIVISFNKTSLILNEQDNIRSEK